MTEFIIKKILTEELFGVSICESKQQLHDVQFFYDYFLCEKFLWGEPISIEELRKLLRQKILNFEFIKLNGDVRPARGTTMMKYIPAPDHPKGIRPSSPKVATFYDMDKKAWRSVSQRSKEIVIKKDEEKDRPIIVVSDKGAKVPDKEKEIKDIEKKQAEKIAKSKDKVRIGPEPEDYLEVGDIRNYLNRNGKNIIIEITRIDDDGSVFARTYKEGTPFFVPRHRMVNIGEVVSPEDLPIKTRKIPVPLSFKKKEEPVILKPVAPTKEEPEKEEPKVLKLIPVKPPITKPNKEEMPGEEENPEELSK